jgi:hypothetical protein
MKKLALILGLYPLPRLQTKILQVDCWTSGLLVSCRRGADQKTRKPSYRYWSAVHVEVLILLFVAKNTSQAI